MSRIAVGETAFEGFRLVGREPMSVVVWAVVLAVLTAVPLAMLGSVFMPMWADIMRSAATGAEASPEEFFRQQAQMMALNPILMLFSLVMRTVLTCAIFRAVLTPQDRGFFYLRLGKAELLVAVVYLVLTVLVTIAAVAGILLIVALGAIVWFASKAAAIGVAIIAGLALFGALVCVMLRLSMAIPMTFAEKRFRFFEAWTLTKGEGGNLFLLTLLVIAIIFLVEMVIGGIVGGVLIAIFASNPPTDESIAAFFAQPPQQWAAQMAPFLVIGGIVLALVGAALYAVMLAPWAAAYRMLVPAGADQNEALA